MTSPFDAAHAAVAIRPDGDHDHDDHDDGNRDGPDGGPSHDDSLALAAAVAGPTDGGLSDSTLEPSPIPAPHRRPWSHAARLFYEEKDGSQTNSYDLFMLWRSCMDTARYWSDRSDFAKSADELKQAGIIWGKFSSVVHASIRLVVTGPYEAWEPCRGDGARNAHAVSRVVPPAGEPYYHVASGRVAVGAGVGGGKAVAS